MCDANNRTHDEENITHHAQRQRRHNAPDQHQHLQRGRFRFLRNEGKPALKKFRNRADQRQRVFEQTGMPRRIARWRALAAHFPGALRLTAKDQAQHEPNSERREYCFCWIFFLERPNAAPGIAPRLFCLAARLAPGLLCFSAVLFRKSACG